MSTRTRTYAPAKPRTRRRPEYTLSWEFEDGLFVILKHGSTRRTKVFQSDVLADVLAEFERLSELRHAELHKLKLGRNVRHKSLYARMKSDAKNKVKRKKKE